jgi:hypothetical protein
VTSTLRRYLSIVVIAFFCSVTLSPAQSANPQVKPTKTGEQLYQSAGVTCHGPDGKGAPPSLVGFDLRLPDFSDCTFTTSEPDVDWIATIHVWRPGAGVGSEDVGVRRRVIR